MVTTTHTSDRLGTDARMAARAARRRGPRASIARYYSLTKPRVLLANALTAVAGYLLASAGRFDLWVFVSLTIGSTLMIASACVLNNVLDRDIDAIMQRTRARATVSGSISAVRAVVFSIILGALGMASLAIGTNGAVMLAGSIGFVTYVVLYGMLSKRMSVHGTLVGSVSGAIPILSGYLAASERLDAGAIIAFAILFLWQMPAFYSISIYRRDEYARAGIPVISVVRGIRATLVQILIYTIAFVLATLLLPLSGLVGIVYSATMAALGLAWIWLGARGLRARNPEIWARQMFRFSMIMVLAICLMVSVGPLLP
ncbi:heme o synthase [Paramicrobacterium chengjingii]|uniref:heme o synthase n=1 Tax=Paramicrobacterium chengjingii TaxID=2769067 RepID=UPI001422BDD4|nr:heme o synthase [Microbacterium chengjingii]